MSAAGAACPGQPDYRAPAWLPGAHAQTIWPAVFAPRPPVPLRRERWETPDGDFIDLDHCGEQAAGRPLVVLFHGLEGSSRSHYARALLAACLARKLAAVVVHFRGCSGELNRLPRAYHSGDSAEADWILRRLAQERAAGSMTGPLWVAGVSLGGNLLLKWLGERGSAARFVAAAAAISAPHDLRAGAVNLSQGVSRLYSWHFLVSLKKKSLAMLDRYPGLLDREAVLRSRNFFDFDEAVTARLHGFASAEDYWRRASCKAFLSGIEVPTLVLNACNDPFQPASVLARADEVSPRVERQYPAEGGHVGFADGRFPGRLSWMPDRVLAHFERSSA